MCVHVRTRAGARMTPCPPYVHTHIPFSLLLGDWGIFEDGSQTILPALILPSQPVPEFLHPLWLS